MDPKLKSLIDKDFIEIVYLDEFSKLGDSLTNLIFSLAITKASFKFAGAKASNFVLSEALKISKFNYLIKKRQSRHQKGNIVEAVLLYCWINEYMDLFEMVTILSAALSFSENRTKQKEIFITAYVQLLDKIYVKMQENDKILGN